MHFLEKKTDATIKRDNLLEAGEIVIVAVSAGPDSMALMHVLAAIAPIHSLTLTAVYVDHGLRPQETVLEAALVKEKAARLGIGYVFKEAGVREYAEKKGMSIEHAARMLRYRALAQAAEKSGAKKIAVAHTADDQAEEVLLRLIRGTGRKGLSGMKTVRDGNIIRPFLEISKAQLLAYLEEKNIKYLTDSSNLERLYLRNRVRLDLVPFLKENFNPNIRRTLRQTAVVLQDEEAYLAKVTEQACQRIIVQENTGSRKGLASHALLLGPFQEEARAVRRRVLETLFWKMETSPRFRQIEAVMRLVASGATEARLHFADGLRVRRQADRLLFSFPQGRTAKRGDLPGPGQAAFEVTITGPGTYPLPQIGQKIIVDLLDRLPSTAELQDPAADYLAADRLAFPFAVRSVRPGDRFHPLGGPGRKKVGDFLTDLKVPRYKRSQVPIVVLDKEIAALLGLRIAHGFRITPDTKQVVRIRLQSL